ncbi:MAG TPA: ABC transporter permease [Candidatus Limnocylindria bacterium]|nr:ABC transporter permease [Candidatus Limnocylindria bacterium]
MTAQPDRLTRLPAKGSRRSQGRSPGEDPVGAVVLQAPPVTLSRGRWRIVAGKEFADHVLSVRFLVLVVILGLAAAAAVYAAAGLIREAAPSVAGQPSLFLKLFTVAPEQLPTFLVLIGFLGPLLGISFGFDAVNGERAERTLPRLLAQPIHRDDVINGKFAAGLAVIGLILAVITAVVAALGILLLGILPSAEDVLRLGLWLVLAVAYVGFWLAFALLCSVVMRRAATSALVAIALWLVLTLFAALLVGLLAGVLAPLPPDATAAQQIANISLQQELARLSPNRLFEEATAAVLDPSVRTVGLVLPAQADRAISSILPLDQSLLVVWPQFVAIIAVTALAFALAYVTFMRQEVRA